jgi:hypothetical protein
MDPRIAAQPGETLKATLAPETRVEAAPPAQPAAEPAQRPASAPAQSATEAGFVSPKPVAIEYPEPTGRMTVTLDDGRTLEVRESIGATTREPGSTAASASPSARRQSSVVGDLGEVHSYKHLLTESEYGLQNPAGASVPGVDHITVGRENGRMRIYANDAKTSEVGRYPKPAEEMRNDWLNEVQAAVGRARFGPEGDQQARALEQEVKQALADGEVYLRQLNVDRSSSGQMRVKLAREPIRVGSPFPPGHEHMFEPSGPAAPTVLKVPPLEPQAPRSKQPAITATPVDLPSVGKLPPDTGAYKPGTPVKPASVPDRPALPIEPPARPEPVRTPVVERVPVKQPPTIIEPVAPSARTAGPRSGGAIEPIGGAAFEINNALGRIYDRQQQAKLDARLQELSPEIERLRREGKYVVVEVVKDDPARVDIGAQVTGVRDPTQLSSFHSAHIRSSGSTQREAENPPTTVSVDRNPRPYGTPEPMSPREGRKWTSHFVTLPPYPEASAQEPGPYDSLFPVTSTLRRLSKPPVPSRPPRASSGTE